MKKLESYTNEELILEMVKRGYVRMMWHKDDVLGKAQEMEVELTEDQIDSVVDRLADTDCEYGINWGVIESAIESIAQ